MRDILKTLKSEHDDLRGLFDEMNATTDRAEKGRTELLQKIEANLIPTPSGKNWCSIPRRKRASHESCCIRRGYPVARAVDSPSARPAASP